MTSTGSPGSRCLKLGPRPTRRPADATGRQPTAAGGARAARPAASSPSSTSSLRSMPFSRRGRPRAHPSTSRRPPRRRRASATDDQSEVADAEQQLQQQKDSAAAEDPKGAQRGQHLHSRYGVGAMRRNELTIGLSCPRDRTAGGLLAARAGPEAAGGEPQGRRQRAPVPARSGAAGGGCRESRRRSRSRSTTASSSCSARRCPRTATRRACWCSCRSSPIAPGSSSSRSTSPTPPAWPPSLRRRHHIDDLHLDQLHLDQPRRPDREPVRRTRRLTRADGRRHRGRRRDPSHRRRGGPGWAARDAVQARRSRDSFFQIADFMKRVDAMVRTRHGGVACRRPPAHRGRLHACRRSRRRRPSAWSRR